MSNYPKPSEQSFHFTVKFHRNKEIEKVLKKDVIKRSASQRYYKSALRYKAQIEIDSCKIVESVVDHQLILNSITIMKMEWPLPSMDLT